MRTESDGRGGVLIRVVRAGQEEPEVFWRAVEAAVERHLGDDRPKTPVLVRIQGSVHCRPGRMQRLRRLHVRDTGIVLVWLPPSSEPHQRS